LGLMEHLARRGVSCPLPVRQRDGEVIGEVAGRPAAVITFLEGMWPRRPTAVHCRAVGAALARLHVAGADFPLTRPNALSLPGWKTLWQGCHGRADEVESGLVAEVEADFARLEAAWPSDLPSGVIHADLFPDNVFFLGDQLSGLIDFYFACNDALAYDLAICVNAWCFESNGDFNATKTRQMIAGYRSKRPLNSREIETFPVLCRGAAFRFLLTRLYDWHNQIEGALVRPHNPIPFLNRLRFHQKTPSSETYGL